MKKILFLWLFTINSASFAQLQNGSIAPDFTLADYNGTNHRLYDYLNAGKTVFLEVFAAHCPVCWSYHQTHTLKDLYLQYGPDASNELMVLALEYDQWNYSNAFIGNGPPWVTQGNWLDGTPYPIFDVEDPNRVVFNDYQISAYPIILKICPDRIIERVFPQQTPAQLYQKVQDCQAALGLSEPNPKTNCYVDPTTRSLVFHGNMPTGKVEIINMQGQVLMTVEDFRGGQISLAALNDGLYYFRWSDANAVTGQKFLLGH